MFSFLTGSSTGAEEQSNTNEQQMASQTGADVAFAGNDASAAEEAPPVASAATDDDISSMEEGEDTALSSAAALQVRLTGQVKMFNDTTFWGFITRLDNKQDVFVHMNDLEPSVCPTPTLFTGEYVSFELAPNGTDKDGNPRMKAVKVRGIESGTLMCDHGEIIYKRYSKIQFGN